MILKLTILAGNAMSYRYKSKNAFLFLFYFFIGSIYGQSNHFKNITISPSTCTNNNGVISIDELPDDITFTWSDGSNDLNRNGLAAGQYILSGEDEDGCIETLVLEVPDISKCDFELVTWSVPVGISPNSDGTTPEGTVRPCVLVGFNFTLDGQPVPAEHLDILWTLTTAIPYPPYTTTYTSNQPIVSIYRGFTHVDVEVSLIVDGQPLSCCSFTDKLFIGSECPTRLPPRVFVNKSTFRNPATQTSIPGLVELLVYGDGTCQGTTDLRGYILDDNNGELIPPQDSNLVVGTSLNIDPGYIRFSDDPNWAIVPNGSIITIYESGHSLNGTVAAMADPTDTNGDFHYILALENTAYFEGYHSDWNYAKQVHPYDGRLSTPVWSLIETNGQADAMQVRYPNGNYCHGFSYGQTNTSVDRNLFALHLTDTEHPYCQIQMNELSYFNKSLFTIMEMTGGFVPGQFQGTAILDILTQLRDCNNVPPPPPNSMRTNGTVQNQLSNPTRLSSNTIPIEDLTTLEVYPNPFQQFLQIDFQSNSIGEGEILIYDSQGKVVQQLKTSCTGVLQSIQIDFGSSTSDGLYLIQFRTPAGQIISKKAVLLGLN